MKRVSSGRCRGEEGWDNNVNWIESLIERPGRQDNTMYQPSPLRSDPLPSLTREWYPQIQNIQNDNDLRHDEEFQRPRYGPGGLEPVGDGESEAYAVDQGVLRERSEAKGRAKGEVGPEGGAK